MKVLFALCVIPVASAGYRSTKGKKQKNGMCPLNGSPEFGNFPEEKVKDHEMLHALSAKEMDGLSDFIRNWDPSVVAPEDAASNVNYLTVMDAIMPDKKQALKYLNGGGSEPKRFAKVTAIRGGDTPAKVVEYKVGPLPLSAKSNVETISEGPYDSRTRDGPELGSIDALVIPAMKILDPMIRKLLGCGYNGRGDSTECLHWHPNAPPFTVVDGKEIRRTIVWMQWRVKGGSRAKDISPTGLDFSAFEPLQADGSIDTSKWYLSEFYYQNQGPFNTAQDLLNAYNSGSLKTVKVSKATVDNLVNVAWPYQRGDAPPGSNIPGPKQYLPEGQRFSVHGGINGEGADVKWMDWELFTHCSQGRGPAAYDIRYRGTRIAWELALQEAFITYSGDDPVRANTFFFDSPYGQGELQPIVVGVDCPEEAVLVANAFYDGAYSGGSVHKEGAFCIFEDYVGSSFWRRNYDAYRGGLPDHELVIRFPMSPGNYDTIMDMRLRMDGSIAVRLKLSGYMQTHVWNGLQNNGKSSDMFGYRVADRVHGSLHDHQFGFKVDMDVLGEKNSFEHLEVKVDTVEKIYAKIGKPVPPYVHLSHMKYIDSNILKTEDEAQFKVTGKPNHYVFINEDKKNGLGNTRGYDLSLFESEGGSIMSDDFIAMNAGSFSKNSITVTKRKEEEATLSGNFDLFRITDPLVSLDNYVNGESIKNEDLVAWVTVSKTHIATAEHYPLIPEVVCGFTIKPFNYFDEADFMRYPSKIIDTSTLEVLQNIPTSDRKCVPR